jgi:hypothetical protein
MAEPAPAPKKEAAGDSNPYAAPLDRLRETVKWLVTVFSGAAGLVLAGSSFSGLGHMELWEPRLRIALAGLGAGVLLLLMAVYMVVPLLGPIQVFGSDLRSRKTTWRDRQDARELDRVRGRIADHAYDLLPTGIVSTDKLLETRERLSAAIAEEQKPGGDKELLATLQAGWDDLDPMFKRVLNYAQFELAYLRFRKRVRALSLLALLALACLAIYAWAANPKPEKEDKSKEKPAPVAVAPVADCAGPAKVQVLEPVVFGFNRHEIELAQFPVIDRALAAVRARPCEVLLLKAHTDTSGDERINIALARRRAAAVRDLLLARGGLAGNRVLTAELPRNDLPRLTPDGVREQANRTVEMTLARPVPAR